jgi:threonine dehydratase
MTGNLVRRSSRREDLGSEATPPSVTLADIEEARRRLVGVIRPTPARFADALSRALGRPVILKPEHLQRAGSFKIRGGYNRISRLEPGVAVVAASAGNHAQGVALASALTGRDSTIFMPDSASLPKIKATEGYGAKVIFGGLTLDDCLAKAAAFAEEHGAIFVPPFDDPFIIAGQGTVGLELVDELDHIDWNHSAPGFGIAPKAPTTVLIPVGGGGLIAGTALALRALRPDIRIIGVEAEGAASMRRSLDLGVLTTLETVTTMADGIALRAPGKLTLALVGQLVDDVITVTEEEISQAVLLLLERAKAVVEPSGAVGLAAVMAGKISGEGPVVAVLSGGNVDPLLLTTIVNHGLSAAGRYLRLRVIFPDRPGSLATLTAEVAALGLNILDVEHHRTGVVIGINEVEVLLTVETRNPEHRSQALAQLHRKGFKAELL